jgi:hypothetical protein
MDAAAGRFRRARRLARLAACQDPAPLLVQYNRDDDLFPLPGAEAAHQRIAAHYAVAGAADGYTGQFYNGPHKFDRTMQRDALRVASYWMWSFCHEGSTAMQAEPELTPPPGTDSTVPSVARGYDYLLGGKDNFAIDRQVVQTLLQVAPEAPITAKANRAFGQRAVRYIAQQGIRQFVDLGSGIPTTPPSVHETVRAVQPDAQVVYVDFDPVVVAHSNALRSVHPGLATILADIRQPEAILNHPELLRHIDFDEPVGIVIFSVLDVVDDAYDPVGIIAQFRERMATGSYLGLSHLSARSTEAAREHSQMISKTTGFPEVQFRSDAEVLRFFDGFDLVEPGLVDVTEWHPEGETPDMTIKLVGAVGRKR